MSESIEAIGARQVITLERPSDGVALITWHHPELRNHGTFAGVDQLADALKEAREGGARVHVLASATPGHWFQHAWLRDLLSLFRGEPTTGAGVGFFTAVAELGHPDVVSIAAMNGDANGGGAELGWACDLRVAEEQVAIGQPEVQIGLTTGLGGTVRLARLIGRTAAAEMIYDGRPLTAHRLHALGAINRVVPAGQATRVALEWARHLAAQPHAPQRAMKRLLQEAEQLPLDEALALEQSRFQEVARTEDAIEQMDAVQARFDAGEAIRAVYGEPPTQEE